MKNGKAKAPRAPQKSGEPETSAGAAKTPQANPASAAKGVAIIVRLPMASGLLSGRMTRDRRFAADDHRSYNRDGAAFHVGETFAGLGFERGLELAGAPDPARVVYAGNDLVMDVQGARDVGILPVLVEHPDHAGRVPDVPEGVGRVSSLPELGDWILERAR